MCLSALCHLDNPTFHAPTLEGDNLIIIIK
jgi:hypothetical protein